MLWYSSGLFALLAIFANIKHESNLTNALVALTWSSTLTHSKLHEEYIGKRCVIIFDKFLANTIPVYLLYNSLIKKNEILIMTSSIPLIIAFYVFHIGKQSRTPRKNWQNWMLFLHIIGSMDCFIYLLSL